jgi:hypothetical protein
MDKTPKTIFVRVGWMKFYSGSRSDDERLIGGGTYNETAIGSEICNFKKIKGNLYGYFQPPGKGPNGEARVNLGRIVPAYSGDELSGVTVVFIACDRNAEGDRERIVGWYRNATVLRIAKGDPTGRRWAVNPNGQKETCDCNVIVRAKDAVLLPGFRRTHAISREMGGMGQANVRYLFDANGEADMRPWMKKALDFVGSYNGENWLTDPLAELPRAAEDELERAAGYESNPAIRRAIEDRAMAVVRTHYEGDGYDAIDRSRSECYDFLCIKRGRQFYVEVKGTRTDGSVIALTPNEVTLPKKKRTRVDLCVVHSINVTGGSHPRAYGGILVRYENWEPRQHSLRPVHFECQLRQEIGKTF